MNDLNIFFQHVEMIHNSYSNLLGGFIVKTQMEELQAVSRKVADYTLDMDVTWDWPGGVAYYGISRFFEVTGDETYLTKMIEWVDEYIEAGLPAKWTVNSCVMGHMLITLYEHTEDEKYLDLILSKIDYLENDALRFGDNVLQHTVSSNNDFPEQCWADTLFMGAYFMVRVCVMLEKQALIDDGLHQFYWHINYLHDMDTNLWYHGYNHVTKDHMSGIYWERGNSWATYTMGRVASIVPNGYLYPPMMHIWSTKRDQLAALKKLQKEDGLWGTVLDVPSAYGEVSATAGIAAGMVLQGNPLHKKYIAKATNGILNNISEQGRVLNVSGGTAVMNDVDSYLAIDCKWAQGWGQGLTLAFFSILIQQLQKQ